MGGAEQKIQVAAHCAAVAPQFGLVDVAMIGVGPADHSVFAVLIADLEWISWRLS